MAGRAHGAEGGRRTGLATSAGPRSPSARHRRRAWRRSTSPGSPACRRRCALRRRPPAPRGAPRSGAGVDVRAGTHSRFAEAAAAGGFQADDVALPQHEVRDLRGQRLASTVADQVERARRRGRPGEPERAELEAVEIGRELRGRAIDAPLTPQAEPAALPARRRPSRSAGHSRGTSAACRSRSSRSGCWSCCACRTSAPTRRRNKAAPPQPPISISTSTLRPSFGIDGLERDDIGHGVVGGRHALRHRLVQRAEQNGGQPVRDGDAMHHRRRDGGIDAQSLGGAMILTGR